MALVVYIHSRRQMDAEDVKEILDKLEYSDDIISSAFDANVNINSFGDLVDHVFLFRPEVKVGEYDFHVIVDFELPDNSLLVECLDAQNPAYKEIMPIVKFSHDEKLVMRLLCEHCLAMGDAKVIGSMQMNGLTRFTISGDPKPYIDIFAERRRAIMRAVK